MLYVKKRAEATAYCEAFSEAGFGEVPEGCAESISAAAEVEHDAVHALKEAAARAGWSNRGRFWACPTCGPAALPARRRK